MLISGVTSGIGRATLFKLLEEGYNVSGFAPQPAKCRALEKELGRSFEKQRFLIVSGNAADEKSLKNVVAKTIKKFKKIDVLFNNAGLWIEGDLEKNSSERISQVLAVNTLGTILLTRLVLPMMKKRKRGLIVNLISQAGLYAKPQRSVYNASKWAITGFTKSLQQELETAGVRVTGVYPGKVETNLFKNAGLNKNMKNALPVDTVARLVTMVVNFSEVATLPEVGVKF